MIFPYSGDLLISSFLSSRESSDGSRIPFLTGLKSGFTSGCNFSFTISATIQPMAGELVSPGDAIPAQSINPGASSTSLITKSIPSSTARSPAKLVITFRSGISFTVLPDLTLTVSIPSEVVAVSSRSSRSVAVGPIRRFP